jgi:hypothetical protein
MPEIQEDNVRNFRYPFVRYNEFTMDDVRIAFRQFLKRRFIPEEYIELYWDEMKECMKSIDEILVKNRNK